MCFSCTEHLPSNHVVTLALFHPKHLLGTITACSEVELPMEIALGAIGPLLPKLGVLLGGEFTLENRVRKGIESLATEMTLMHAALRKVAKVPPHQLDEGVKIWAGNVRELSYQMEDIVDSFMVRVEDGGEGGKPKNRVKKMLKKTINLFKKGKDLHHISDALEEASGQAKQLAELRQRYEQEMWDTGAGASVDPRLTAMYKDVTELVGVEETRDKVINMVLEGDNWSEHPLKTVSIVGFGGIGKTTLAKAAYDMIKVHFDCNAFVSVSQNPDMKKVLKNILYELDKVKYADIHNATREENHLIDEIIEYLTNKRYLIVIDDIWDEKAWQLIKCAFSKRSLGSRLITTTRIVSVSQACCSSSDDIHRMQPLSLDLSRRLFNKRVFSHDKECPPELVQVSENILEKCGGIPLAIIAISSLLASNGHIKAKDQWYALLNSIGHGLTEDCSVEEMKRILLFSYTDLPSYLKPCLLYLSIFPEDYKIKRGELIRKWISEGLVYSERQESSLYELGDSYFNELVNRSMIQPIGIDDEEKVEACRVHDMVLDLICSLACQENFVTILDGTERKKPSFQSKVRRLSIQNSKVHVDSISMATVRSLTIFTSGIAEKLLKNSSFQVLRMLDIEDGHSSNVGYVWNLLHLRYLVLGGSDVEEWPVNIGRLQLLQTLDMSGTSIKEVPSSIVRLRRLMFLYFNKFEEVKLPCGLGKLASLEVLKGIVVGRDSSGNVINIHLVKELGCLTKLRVLSFVLGDLDENMSKDLVESLGNMHKLECLDIDGIDDYHGAVDYMREGWSPPVQLRRLVFRHLNSSFLTLPAWINPSSLPLLSYLEINVRHVQPEDIQLLGVLPALRCLYICLDSDIEQEQHVVEMSVVTPDAFPCATECYFQGIAAVPSVFPRGAAPKLQYLIFLLPSTWVAREDFNLGMDHLPSLQFVDVRLLCGEASSDLTVNEAEAALKAAAEDHPNKPRLYVFRRTSYLRQRKVSRPHELAEVGCSNHQSPAPRS